MLRLDRLLSNATALTRSQAHKVLRAGRVSVDGVTIRHGAFQVDPDAQVSIDGQLVAAPSQRYLMFNKPLGVVCATRDPSHRTVIDLLDVANPEGLHFAGRLDIDATGLVLITDDGQWSHRITAPSKKCSKIYRVGLVECITDADLARIRSGLLLRGETKLTAPAQAQRIDETQILLTITEGRYHQVKRLFAAVGNRVETLHRESIGDLTLDARLAPGEFRPLTQDELGLFH
ncbi:MAG: pseudouridine synthase [Candidatus Thiodiazotropha sp.]